MIKQISVITFVFISGMALSAQQYYVTLYDQCNYSGRRYTLEAGSYRLYQMKIDNDKLSSLEIPSGMKVTIYENDKFEGRSNTYNSNQPCLDPSWRNTTSSLVVENTNIPSGYTSADYVTFYNDCYSRGYSQSLRPGSYTASQLGNLRNNISSLSINGNLRVKAYINNDNLSGYSVIFDVSQTCLPASQNDKIGSLVIEAKPAGIYNNGGYGNIYNGQYATLYAGCNFTGNALRLEPGYYQGEKLGILKYNISSLELPAGLRIKVFQGNEYLSGQSYTFSSSENCLNSNLRNRIGSVVIEETDRYGGNNNPGYGDHVIIYEDENYHGRSSSLIPGTYATMDQIGFPDKALSSLFVPAGWRVVLYEFENFGGKSYTVTASKTGFILTGWNDKTSSITVYKY